MLNKNLSLRSKFIHNNKKLKRREPRYIYWERIINSKKNPDRKRYFAFFLKTKNNVFVTITNSKGEVVISRSAGDCKIKTKKKKKSWDTLKEVANAAAKIARIKNIKYIYKFFMSNTYAKNAKLIQKSFRGNGLFILKLIIVKKRPFSSPMRKKKSKRL
jgi:ribosomal protein S11